MTKMKPQEKHVGKMETQLRQWGAKLDEMKAADTEKWETFKTGVESAWNELEVAFKNLAK